MIVYKMHSVPNLTTSTLSTYFVLGHDIVFIMIFWLTYGFDWLSWIYVEAVISNQLSIFNCIL